jgi:4-hydroxybenzoyl-CoA thioesterase
VTEKTSGREVARGKTGIVFVNPGTRRIGHMPEAFRARWP